MQHTGKTKNLGVIGYPIVHSLSPIIQNAALEHESLNYVYIAMPIAPDDLARVIPALPKMGFAGFNVTIPHKITVMPLLDEIDEAARCIGAVNTVVIEQGKLHGYNTDVAGFINPLIRRKLKLIGSTVIICGAGGASRAVIYGLLKQGVANIVLQVRNTAKAEGLREHFSKWGKIIVCNQEDAVGLLPWYREATLLVNTTPLGMHPETDKCPPVYWEYLAPDAWVYDIIYTPAQTQLLTEAAKRGYKWLNGQEMLAEQGAVALSKWVKRPIDSSYMTKVLSEYLDSL